VRRGQGLRFLCVEHLHTKTDRDKFLTPGELKEVFEKARAVSLRDFSVLWICAVLGLRVSELVELRRCDFNLQQRVAWIDVRKRGQHHSHEGRVHSVIPRQDFAPVKAWVKRFRGSSFVFPGQTAGTHMSERTAQLIFKRAAKAAGILAVRPKASIHSLRHTRAVLLLEQTGDVSFVQRMLRHRNRSTTEQYLHLLPSKLKRLSEQVSLLGGGEA
jgi:integrase